MAVTENDVLVKFKDSSGNINFLYPITRKGNVDGLVESIRDQTVTTAGSGSAYTATVEGITSLTAGVSFVMIPHVVSATDSPTLNVNGLGNKHLRRRVTNATTTTTTGGSSSWLSAGKPIRVFYDGTYWIADLPKPNALDILGTVQIQNGGTGANTAADARVNLGIETVDGTVTSGNADYAEVGEWADGNPNAEDRIGYFVCVDLDNPGIIMKKATINDGIRGVTVAAPAFAGGCSDDAFDSEGMLIPKYSYVAVMGIVPVIDNGTCTVGGRCMPASDSTAVPVSGDYGYQVMDRIDDTHVFVAVEPGSDYQYRINNELQKTVPISRGGTGATDAGTALNNLGAVDKKDLGKLAYKQLDANGNATKETITAYPTAPGVYRVGPVGVMPLPGGWGNLIIFETGYITHIFENGDGFWVQRTEETYTVTQDGWRRLPAIKTSTGTLTASGWSGNDQWVGGLTGVTVSNTVLVAPHPDSYYDYVDNGIRCTGQPANENLSFQCQTIPSVDVKINVLALS